MTRGADHALTINLTARRQPRRQLTVPDYFFNGLAASGNYTVLRQQPLRFHSRPAALLIPAGNQTGGFTGLQVRAITPAGNNVSVQVHGSTITFANVSSAAPPLFSRSSGDGGHASDRLYA